MISIVLPCLNEIRHGYLSPILDNLDHQTGEKEIIAIVSPSQDETAAVIAEHPAVKLIHTPVKNRAERLNVGINAGQGEIVLLHHPATLLPEHHALDLIRQAMVDPTVTWGGFRHSFDLDHWLLRFTSWYSNKQRARRGILYLDHCIFARRAALLTIHGVPEADIFEDTLLSQSLRQQFGPPHLVSGTVITSARRFQDRGIFRHALINQLLKLGYHLGMSPQALNRLYEYGTQINKTYR